MTATDTRIATTGTCTVTTRATGGKCGADAVHAFIGVDGRTYFECAAHSTADIGGGSADGHTVGDIVTVHRYGKAYRAVVTRVGARGAVYATFTYGNGTDRTVRV